MSKPIKIIKINVNLYKDLVYFLIFSKVKKTANVKNKYL